MSAAKKLQSKLFGAVTGGAATPGQSTPTVENPQLGLSAPAAGGDESPGAGSGAATPVPPPVDLRIDIPPVNQPGQTLNERASERTKEQLPKRPTLQADSHPPAPEQQTSPQPNTAGSETDTPGTTLGDARSQRERLQQSLGPRYRSVEEYRLDQSDRYDVHWKRWGPYVSERQWGTVREDYSANGDAWNSFPFEMATSRAYRWGEDGIAGISDNHQRLCFTLGLWNGKDSILKERLYGLNGSQGNHGEDVKEIYYYLDSTPTHSYMKFLYKYPQGKYPYEQLQEENRNRSRDVMEFELMDTDLFDEDRYWDVFVEYAKDEENADAISIRITAYNRGPDPADLHIIPQLFFRNTWSWTKEMPKNRPLMKQEADGVINAKHDTLGTTRLYCTPSPAPAAPARGGVVLVDGPSVVPELLFTENETNFERLYNGKNRTPYVKDAFHDHIIPSHRPKEPEPERSVTSGLPMKSPKSPAVSLRSLPGDATDPIANRSPLTSKESLDGDSDVASPNGSASSPETGKVSPPVSEDYDESGPRDCEAVGAAQELPRHTGGQAPENEERLAQADMASIKDGLGIEPKAGLDKSPTTPAQHIAPAPPPPRTSRGARQFVNPDKEGTKAAANYIFTNVPPKGGCVVVRLKLTPATPEEDPSILDEEMYDDTIEERRVDADEFYARIARNSVSEDLRNIMRQALSGMLWTKQYYQFIQKEWMEGDSGQPPPPSERKWVRNREWKHMYINDILSMPDKWEYPWFATWDTAFHCIPLAMVDPAFAKKQLDLMTREWYMKPDGALPAYEWNFSDVNPPVHAWSTFRVFKIERKFFGREDLDFLERVFQKLLLNFTWWVNRKDAEGNNVFEGGFLGLDNIGPFNRSEPLPTGGTLRQADGTAWMAFFCLNMLSIALELAKHNPTYEDIASKFFEHFLFISDAMTYSTNDEQFSLWNEQDGFYYDAIQWGYGNSQQLPVRSMVGLIPLYATLVLEPGVIKRFPGFKKRMEWFIENRPDISTRNVASLKERGKGERRLLALASKERLVRILEKMLDETEFLSDYGVRSMSLYHHEHPYSMNVNGQDFGVAYWPGDSRSGMFGGNSNWRGPIWLAVNFLLIESLQRFHQYYGETLQVECPTGSGDYMNLAGCAEEIQHRLIHIFARDENGRRAVNAGNPKLNRDPHFRDYVHFYEFFHGNDGRGLGASHQTGWTGLVAWSIMQTGEYCRLPKTPRTPRSVAKHYFDEHINTPSEFGDGSLYSAYSDFSAVDPPEPEDL